MAEIQCLFAYQIPVPRAYTCVRHRHPCTEIVFTLDGDGSMFYGEQSFTYGPASVFTYQPGPEHWITQGREGAHVCMGVHGCGAAEIAVGSFAVGPSLSKWLRAFRAALVDGTREQIELLSGLIALDLATGFPRNRTVSLAQRACAIIERDYRKPLTVAGLARQLFISPDYLRQLFRAEFSYGPLQFLLRRRIDAATELLRFSPLPIQEVAEQCGIENPYYFSRLFRKITGKTPSSVRGGEQRRLK